MPTLLRGPWFVALCALNAAIGCSSRPLGNLPSESDASIEPDQHSPGIDAGPETSADSAPDACVPPSCAYGAMQLWQEPITDYIQDAAELLKVDQTKLHRSIDDLSVFDGRLYFGYGDATLNAGRVVPIQIRYWADPGDSAPLVDLQETTEEEIAQFRVFGDTLYVPGVDATEDAFLGNVFSRNAGGEWIRHRSVYGGVHVHDVAEFKSALYSCGSGARDLDTWNTGKVRSFLWRSLDDGNTWETVAEVPNDTTGDRRWVQMLPFQDRLLLFGYRTNSTGSINALLSDSFDGNVVTKTTIGAGHFVVGTELVHPGIGVIRGVAATVDPLLHETLVVRQGDSSGERILEGKVVLDLAVVEPGKAVLVVGETDAYPSPATPTPWHVLFTEDWASFRELATGQSDGWPTAVAYWKGGLYVGTDDGKVYRSLPQE